MIASRWIHSGASCRENQKTRCTRTFSTLFRKLCRLWDSEEKYGTAGQFIQGSTTRCRTDAICVPYNQGKPTDTNS